MLSALNIAQAIQHLYQGEVIAYPTEAVWGLGCDPFNEQAFNRILQLKQRALAKGVILITANLAMLSPLVKLTKQQAKQLAAPTTPTTFLVPYKKHQVPNWIVGKHDLLAVRITQHPVAKALCEQFNGCIVSTSANPSGCSAATMAFQVKRYFPKLPLCKGTIGHAVKPSRIIDITSGHIIRG